MEPRITPDEILTAADLIQAVRAQAEPTCFELALVRHVEDLEKRLEAALNDLTALHASRRRQIVLDNQGDPSAVLKLKIHTEGEDEVVTLH